MSLAIVALHGSTEGCLHCRDLARGSSSLSSCQMEPLSGLISTSFSPSVHPYYFLFLHSHLFYLGPGVNRDGRSLITKLRRVAGMGVGVFPWSPRTAYNSASLIFSSSSSERGEVAFMNTPVPSHMPQH